MNIFESVFLARDFASRRQFLDLVTSLRPKTLEISLDLMHLENVCGDTSVACLSVCTIGQ